jgi:CBS domain containing-hemolysin-like protein
MKKNSVRGAMPFILTVAALSFPISGVFDTATIFLNQTPWYVGLFIVVGIVLVGAAFDMLGVASAAARETPFHAMASKRVFGARRAVDIVRNAEKVSSICSDVIGDIAGVLSGAGSLAVAVQLAEAMGAQGWYRELGVIVITALTTSLTVGAKALGKTLAIHSPTPIILFAARLLDTLTLARSRGRRPRTNRKTR